MNNQDRFLHSLNFKKTDDRLPMVEWAAWWDKTLRRWEGEGMPKDLTLEQSLQYFGLDYMTVLYAAPTSDRCPQPDFHGGPVLSDEKSYEEIKPFLFTEDAIEMLKRSAMHLKGRHAGGEIIIRLAMEGFFWFPRTLFGIEPHMFAFYDYPELMHRINSDLADFHIRTVEAVYPILEPDMVGFSEDMSYNHGPMLSYDLFKEFIMPYYHRVIPHIKKHGTKIFIDSDGDIYKMIPWMNEAGIEGVFPLERQAGVDIVKIRREYPDLLMLGGFDKMVMPLGEESIRNEFERIFPVMISGGYIPSVDHMTPPGVSLDHYKVYLKLFKEYSEKAVVQYQPRKL